MSRPSFFVHQCNFCVTNIKGIIGGIIGKTCLRKKVMLITQKRYVDYAKKDMFFSASARHKFQLTPQFVENLMLSKKTHSVIIYEK